jgi:hypothetical protein
MTAASEFIYQQTITMAKTLGASDIQAERAARDARHEYKTAAVIKGGVSAMIERRAKEAAKNSKKDAKRGA